MASAVCRTAHLHRQYRLKDRCVDRCGQPARLWLRVAFGLRQEATPGGDSWRDIPLMRSL
jgi:hypothetical protein